MTALTLQSYRSQYIFTEYASLKHLKLRGIYVSLTPGNAGVWAGVLFVRKGPYHSAVLRFSIHFGDYPLSAPDIIFRPDIFHPLVAPAGGPPMSNNTKREGVPGRLNLSERDRNIDDNDPFQNARVYSIIEILVYMRSCFEDEKLLDSIPLEAAANPDAWHAWQAHRTRYQSLNTDTIAMPDPRISPSDLINRTSTPHNSSKKSDWEGLWEDRVEKVIQNSLSDAALYGDRHDDETIHFAHTNGESTF